MLSPLNRRGYIVLGVGGNHVATHGRASLRDYRRDYRLGPEFLFNLQIANSNLLITNKALHGSHCWDLQYTPCGCGVVNEYAIDGSYHITPGSGNNWGDGYRLPEDNMKFMSTNKWKSIYGITDKFGNVNLQKAGQMAQGIVSRQSKEEKIANAFSIGLTYMDKYLYTFNNSMPFVQASLNGTVLANLDISFWQTGGWMDFGGFGELAQNGGGANLTGDPAFTFSNSTERGVNLTSTIIGGSVSAGASQAANSGKYLANAVKGAKLGGNILGSAGFVVTSFNVGAKRFNGTDNTADYVDLTASGALLGAGFLVSNPIGWGVLIGAGVIYGIYRIAAGDEADALINENFGFRD